MTPISIDQWWESLAGDLTQRLTHALKYYRHERFFLTADWKYAGCRADDIAIFIKGQLQ